MLSEYYLIIKALHIIAVICWMVGLLYLPRLFVYHVNASAGSELDITLRTMERRLLHYIMNPSMVVTTILGLLLIHNIGFAGMLWLHVKLLLVLVLFVLHIFMVFYTKKFANGQNEKSQVFFRILNEVPSLLMVIIVILAIVKPM